MFIYVLTALVVFSVIVSLSGHEYLIRFSTSLMMWIALAQSLNTITGYTGRIDFGHVLFFGLGAYATAYMILNNYPWYVGMLVALVVGLLSAVILGYPVLRLHGAYFAIATWSFAEASKQIMYGWMGLGGSFGLPLKAVLSSRDVLYLMTVIATASLILNFFIERSKIGLAFSAIRNNELVASISGVNVVHYRVLAYALSSIAASLAGGAYALWINYVYPGDVFHGLKTDQMFVMLLLGGAGTYIGPLIGSIILGVIYEMLWTLFSEQLYLVFLGVFLMIIVVFMPNGIAFYLGFKTVSGRKLLLSLVPIPITKSLTRDQRISIS